MNTHKSWLLTMSMLVLFVFSAIASPLDSKEPKSVKQQFTKLLKGMNMGKLADGKTLYVDFIINDLGEILVLSTNDETLDSRIKTKLNYKKINSTELIPNKKYTLPISFKR
jgi:hypothetical protein